jgi:hypothetical protein
MPKKIRIRIRNTGKIHEEVTKQKKSRFFLLFLLDDVTNGSGRPKNIRIPYTVGSNTKNDNLGHYLNNNNAIIVLRIVYCSKKNPPPPKKNNNTNDFFYQI